MHTECLSPSIHNTLTDKQLQTKQPPEIRRLSAFDTSQDFNCVSKHYATCFRATNVFAVPESGTTLISQPV